MQARHSLARRVTSAGLAVLFAASALLACLPVTAEAAEARCPSAARMPDCDHPRLDCCDAAPQGAPALPDTSPASRPDAAKHAAGLDTPTDLAIVPPSPLDARRALAPAHGYRFTDLVTLHSVFLI